MTKRFETAQDNRVSEVQPKVIFVDWYKTLSTSLFWVDHPKALLTPQELSRVSRSLFDEPGLIDLWMKGFTNSETVCAEASVRTNLDPYKILQELAYSAQHMELYDPEVSQIIQRVRNQGTKVVLATDNMDTFERWTAPSLKLGLVFDDIITSASRGALKSEFQGRRSPFFGHYLGQVALDYPDAVLIDDMPIADMVASTGLGFQHIEHPSQLASILGNYIIPTE
jgi:FMN phosphatase YigB (HAD superfamily)